MNMVLPSIQRDFYSYETMSLSPSDTLRSGRDTACLIDSKRFRDIKISLIGPENIGKSVFVDGLSQYFFGQSNPSLVKQNLDIFPPEYVIWNDVSKRMTMRAVDLHSLDMLDINNYADDLPPSLQEKMIVILEHATEDIQLESDIVIEFSEYATGYRLIDSYYSPSFMNRI